MKPIAISLSPNTTSKDYAKAWSVLMRAWTWRDASVIERIRERFSRMFEGRHVVVTSSGRQALYDTLRALSVGEGDEVIIQAFTCIAVPAPITWVKAKPIYADVSPGSYVADVDSIRQKITDKTKAIIVQHTFGMPGPIEEVMALAKEHSLVVIEDCAHALGSTYKGKMLGTFGDVAILSFGRDKMISSVFGGAVVTNNEEIQKKVTAYAEERSYPPLIWVKQQLLHPILFHWIVPTYFTAAIGKVLLVVAQKLQLLSKAVEVKERDGGMPQHIPYKFSPALAQLVEVQLDQLEAANIRRREIVQRYVSAFASLGSKKPVRLPDVSSDADPALLRFPIQVDDPKGMHAAARKHNMMLGDWYDTPLAPKTATFTSFSYTDGMCPNAENVSSKVMNLPTYPTLTDDQVESVVTFVQNYSNGTL